MKQGVLIDCLRTVGLAIATHVRRDDVKSSFRERLQLMTPRVPRLGETMTQDDQWTCTALGDVHANAVGFEDAMLYFVHGGLQTRALFRHRRSGNSDEYIGTWEREK